jgi:hypothetical protein
LVIQIFNNFVVQSCIAVVFVQDVHQMDTRSSRTGHPLSVEYYSIILMLRMRGLDVAAVSLNTTIPVLTIHITKYIIETNILSCREIIDIK